MKFTLVLLAVAAFVGCTLSWSCTDEDWAKYKSTFNKNYPDPSDDLIHHNVYCKRLKEIEENNAKVDKGVPTFTFKMEVNKFTDMTEEELFKIMGVKNNTNSDGIN